MGDAADDVYDASMRRKEDVDALIRSGGKPCPRCGGDGSVVGDDEDDCGLCLGLGWIDADGNPCEL